MDYSTIRMQFFVVVSILSMVAGCKSLGPRVMPGDRFHYNESGAQSASEQLLLNIVRLRYGEPTYWLEITSMLSQYELKAGGMFGHYDYTLKPIRSAALRAVYGLDHDAVVDGKQELNLDFSDRPTITYAPLQGREFADRLMAPIPPATVIYLAESGWPIDRVMDCCVQRINGVSNAPVYDVGTNENFDPTPFNRVTELLRSLQDRGDLRFSLEYDAKERTAYLQPLPEAEANSEAAREGRKILGMEQRHPKLKLVNKPNRGADDELALQTRSLLGTMFALSESFTPPADHLKSGQVLPGTPAEQNASAKWLDIQCSKLPVTNAFVQVHHNGYWFYIPRSDFRSKRTFSLLTYLFLLQSADVSGMGPMLTVPAGG
ncbi:MAG: hypothetical protein HY287_06495 [Planctomycetes bacterium]|nr:hypothetical protein [Planctomycetota bacterium]MBI3833962.1 hypothetical protein [Planctomycetota bacterium]